MVVEGLGGLVVEGLGAMVVDVGRPKVVSVVGFVMVVVVIR
jgi:hypothetical protein